MKTTYLPFALLTACVVLPVSGLFAQTPTTAAPASTPSVSAPAATAPAIGEEEGAGGKMRARFASLTPEEKQKLMAANRAAMKDPAVQAAKAERQTNPKAFREARREAMLKADPSVAPILEKLKEEHKDKKLKNL